jgi:hypothetical protein
MPIRLLAILGTLLTVTFALLALAWLTESELFFFLPWRRISPPPTHPGLVACFLAIPFVVTVFSRHYGLVVFTLFPVGLLLGSIVGFVALGWTPSLCQHLLCVSAIAASGYAWSQRDYFDY